jgi:hypothetical protein
MYENTNFFDLVVVALLLLSQTPFQAFQPCFALAIDHHDRYLENRFVCFALAKNKATLPMVLARTIEAFI